MLSSIRGTERIENKSCFQNDTAICSLSKLIHVSHGVFSQLWHLFRRTLNLTLPHLPIDEVDAFYLPLSGLADVHMEGGGKVRQPYSAFNKISHHTPTSWKRTVINIARRYPQSYTARLSGYLASIRHPSARGESIDHAYEIVKGLGWDDTLI